MFLREVVTGKKEGKPVRYAQIVEAFRNEQGKSRHRVLLPLGRVDRIDKPRIQQLVKSLSRYLETGVVPDGGHVGEVREFGVGFVANAIWRKLDLPAFFAKQLRSRKFEAPLERAIFAMVAHRLVDPCSKLQCADWLEHDAWLDGATELGLQHLYRAMDFLDECHEDLEKALYEHRRTLFDRVELVYYDTTSTWFDCDDSTDESLGYGLRQHGHSRDLRPDRRQIVIGLAVDQNSLPIVSDVFSGDTTDAVTVVPLLSRLRDLGLRRVVWVADRGMASELNLSAVKAAGLHYVIGVRLRQAEELREAIARADGNYVPADEGLMVREVTVAGKRHVVCFSPASAERDLKFRTGQLDRLRATIERVNAGADSAALTTNGLFNRLVTKDPNGAWYLDKRKLEREAQCDGTFVLEVSDPALGPIAAAKAYKGLLRVERTFRALKNGVDIRPVYHRLDRRIRAHVTLCLLALLIERVIELETKKPFEQVRKTLTRMRAVKLTFEKQVVWETTGPTKESAELLKSLKLEVPRLLTGK